MCKLRERRSLDCVNLVGISFASDGRSLEIEIRASIPPYAAGVVYLENVIVFKMARSQDDGFPYFIPELSWQVFAESESQDILAKVDYPFRDVQQEPTPPQGEIVVLNLEGAICGEIVAERVEYIESAESEN